MCAGIDIVAQVSGLFPQRPNLWHKGWIVPLLPSLGSESGPEQSLEPKPSLPRLKAEVACFPCPWVSQAESPQLLSAIKHDLASKSIF